MPSLLSEGQHDTLAVSKLKKIKKKKVIAFERYNHFA